MKVKNYILLYCARLIVGLYTTFVLIVLWDWFVVPVFHLGPVTFWEMYGLTLLISLFQASGSDIAAEHRHKIIAVMLDSCVPNDKREEVREQLEEFTQQIWYDAGWKIFGQIIGNSIALGIGFVVHGLAS